MKIDLMKKQFLTIAIVVLGSINLLLAQSVTFNYTGAMQQYVVPPGVTGLCYTVCGGQGMGNGQNSMLGGLGGRVMGVLAVTPGQVLEIRVGNGGIATNIGGFNGGANGGSVACCPNSRGGGGGGASDIRVAPYGLANRVAVGGGGGGTGGNRIQGCSPGCGGGGGGGWYGGGGGGAYGGSPGQGGTQVAGGLGGASCCGCPLAPQPGAAGAFGLGGNGGNLSGCNNQAANNPGCAGGHAGGLVGLAGPNCTNGTGCPSTWAGASGAGGSSYGIPASTPTLTGQFQTGNGIVILNPNCCASPSLTAGATPSAVCPGQLTTLTVTGAGAGGTYTWLPMNITGSNIAVSPTATTIYTVQGAAATSTCTGTQTVQVVLNTPPVPVVNNPTACVGSDLLFTANGGTAYVWAGPSAYNSAVQNPTVTNAQVSNAGNYTVIVTGANGCTASAVSQASVAPVPTLSILGTNTMCSQSFNGSNNTVALSVSGANTYTWANPAGYMPPTGTGANFNITAPVVLIPSIDNVTVSATGALGCTAQAVYNLTVIPNPVLTFAPAQPTLCYGKTATISVSGAQSYVWANGNTLNTTTGSLVTANPLVNTTYTVIGSALGCNSDNHFITATVVPNPTVFISSGTPTICYGTGMTLIGNGAFSYTWYPNVAINNVSVNNPIVSPLSNTQYTLVGELNTCTSTAVVEVTVIPLPTLQMAADKTTICYGGVANLVANGAFNYQWSPSTGLNNPNSNVVVASPEQTTIYTVMGNNGACIGSASVQINVVPRPELILTTNSNKICKGTSTTIFASGSQNFNWSPIQSINLVGPNTASVNPTESTNYTITAYNTAGTLQCSVTREILIEVVPQVTAAVSGNVSICEGESTMLLATGSNMYVWTPTVGLSDPSVNNPYASPKSTTIYQVIVSNQGFCGATGTVMVTVRPQPTVDAGIGGTFNLDEPMYLNAIGNGTLTWIAGDGILCNVCPNTQLTTNKGGCYKIQAVNEYGCKAYDDVCIEVTANYNLYIPNSFTPNGDGVNDVFQIFGTGFKNVEIIVFDRWGEKLFTTTDAQKGWDGTYKGVNVKDEVYVYQVKFATLDGKQHTKTGHVTILK